jgi:hypothetical protein
VVRVNGVPAAVGVIGAPSVTPVPAGPGATGDVAEPVIRLAARSELTGTGGPRLLPRNLAHDPDPSRPGRGRPMSAIISGRATTLVGQRG